MVGGWRGAMPWEWGCQVGQGADGGGHGQDSGSGVRCAGALQTVHAGALSPQPVDRVEGGTLGLQGGWGWHR